MTRQVLPGFRPQPLAAYLSGLGLIRLLGEQADPGLTASWTDEGLVIESTVADIPAWLAESYAPTPLVSPWNGGSGFGEKDVKPKATLEALRSHPSPRLAPFRAAIEAATRVAAKFHDGRLTKEEAILELRNRCPDALLPWIDATVVLTGGDAYFPPLLGTGGNDGRLDFSTNFHQRLAELFDEAPKARAAALAQARDLLAGSQTQRLASAAIGQFDPGGAGGPQSSPFGAADSMVNPWAFVLLVEGALLFASSASRRHQHGARRAAIPFTVFASPDGSASGAAGEESRGEVWTPIWTERFALPEIRQLFAEARASWRGRSAQRAVEFYAATRTLGVARGVDAFVRYGLHRRNGLAFAAVPIERVDVRDNPHVRLVARLEDWAGQVRRADTSQSVGVAVRAFDAAHLAYVRDGGPQALCLLLATLTDLELAVGRSGRLRDSLPVREAPGASAFLPVLAEAGSAEMRVAVGVASCATWAGKDPVRHPSLGMRHLLLPIGPDRRWRNAAVVPGFGLRPPRSVLADVLVWRSRTAADEEDAKFRGVPTFRTGIPAPAGDLHAFAFHACAPPGEAFDDGAFDLCLRACLALDWRHVKHTWPDGGGVPLVPTLGLLHPLAGGLAAPHAESDAPRFALGPDWAVRLAAGQVRGVHHDAVRRLRQAGWEAAPALPAPDHLVRDTARDVAQGMAVAAALVPRCHQPRQMMSHLARPLRATEATAPMATAPLTTAPVQEVTEESS